MTSTKKETKTMGVNGNQNAQANLLITNDQIEQLGKFKYLDNRLCDQLDPDMKVRTRIEI